MGLQCSQNTYVYIHTLKEDYTSYCSKGYDYYTSTCCNHAGMVGGICAAVFAMVLGLIAMIVCV